MIYAQDPTSSDKPDLSIDPNEIVAEAGGIKITVEEFMDGYEYGPAFIKRSQDSKRKYLKYLINEKLLAQRGLELGLEKTDIVNETYAAIKDDIATEELFKEDILKNISISSEELDTIINRKQLELEIKWLYAKGYEEIAVNISRLHNGIDFDTLFNSQLSEEVFADMRSMNTTRYQLGIKNPLLADIIDTLKVGSVSAPIHTDDGWYIVKLENIRRNMIINETEYQKYAYEAKQAVMKIKMDSASDVYVNNLMNGESPVIDKDAFSILRSYLGRYVLPSDVYNDWNLHLKMEDLLEKFSDKRENYINELPLVNLSNGIITIEHCLIWYRNRAQYIKFNKTDLNAYSNSLMQMIWRMVRDELLVREAAERNMYDKETVKNQSEWWKAKILFSALLNEYKNSITQVSETSNYTGGDKLNRELQKEEYELSKKLFYEINKLTQKYPVSINENVLNGIIVSDENNPAAIELYTVKKGGLIPRTPYPTIDMIWELWE